VVIAVVARTLDIALPLLALASVISVEVASNLLCVRWLRRGGAPSARFLGALMGLDVLLLTMLLYLTGGPYNPFNFLYVVHIALAAAVLPPRWTWGLVTLALGCFAGLFLDHLPLPNVSPDPAHAHHDHMGLHMKGMWVAFGVAALFIAYFGHRVTYALAERDRQLSQIRAEKARGERLLGLATLAAGAAHELSTPLSTIAVVAGELEAELAREHAERSLRSDAELIAHEVRRCQHILQQMAGSAGQSVGENVRPVTVDELIRTTLEGFDPNGAEITVDVAAELNSREIAVPVTALAQTLRGLVKNALDASASAPKITLAARVDGDLLRLEVIDQGHGMSEDQLARAGEPFFTTKDTGKGMGLGLFLAHELARQLGGTLQLESVVGRGTRASLLLPALETATFRHIVKDRGFKERGDGP
jgi:two-component system sensor histidine kinase RegB